MTRYILASKSPRRKELMELGGYTFDIITSDEEEVITSSIPSEVVMELSGQKALNVCNKVMSDVSYQSYIDDLIIIGADTIVAVDDLILGKPASEEDAFSMLKLLSGRSHEVYTGVTFVKIENGEVVKHSFYEETKVLFYEMTNEEILQYIATGDPMDKAGGYGIQSKAAKFVKSISGEYNNVVGLPIARIYHELGNF